MGNIELVIKIPEEVKHKVYAYGLSLCPSDKEQLIHAIMNGTPLPKGHGRLIDADKLKQRIQMADDDIMEEDWYKLYDSVISDIDNATKIIEADKEDKE